VLERNAAKHNSPRTLDEGSGGAVAVESEREIPVANRSHQIHGKHITRSGIFHRYQGDRARAQVEDIHGAGFARRNRHIVISIFAVRSRILQIVSPSAQERKTVISATGHVKQT
jgi:hypothetical protein